MGTCVVCVRVRVEVGELNGLIQKGWHTVVTHRMDGGYISNVHSVLEFMRQSYIGYTIVLKSCGDAVFQALSYQMCFKYSSC